MTFHSELQIVRLIFEGGVSSIVDSMHDVMRRGRGGHNITVTVQDICLHLTMTFRPGGLSRDPHGIG